MSPTMTFFRPLVICAIVCLAIASVLAIPRVSFAQRSSQTEADSERARELFGQAVTAIDAKDFQKARQLLTEALALMESFDIAGALGQAELELGLYRDAAQHFRYSLRQFPPSESRKLKQKVEEGLAEAQRYVGTLEVEATPAGAEILVDGTAVGKAPLDTELFVSPGLHTLEARWEGGDHAVQSIEAFAGRGHKVRLEPAASEPSPPAAPVASGSSTPEANGNPPMDSPPPANGKSWVPVYVGAGVTAAGLATWIGFHVAAENAQDDADAFNEELAPDGCTTGTADADACRESQDAYDRQRRNRTISRVGAGVTVVGALATVAYVVFWPTSAPSSTARVQPTIAVDPTGGSFYLGGSF